MIPDTTAQILLQPWLERRQIGRPWLIWFLLAAALILPMVGVVLRDSRLAMLLFMVLVILLTTLWWLMLATSALKQNTTANSRLVPGFSRRLLRTMLASYAIASLAVASVVALTIGPMITTKWNAIGGIVALAALALAVFALSLRSQWVAWIGFLTLMFGTRVNDFSQWATAILFDDFLQFPAALVALAGGAVGLAWSYRRPRQGGTRWTIELWQADALTQQRLTSFLYRRALLRDISRKRYNALLSHATGPGAHWTTAAQGIPFFLLIAGFLSFMKNPLLWMFAIALPMLLCSVSVAALRHAAHVTRAEQRLLVLTPHTRAAKR